MHFPIVIHKEAGSGYGVTVPDLPGCFSAGDTLEEAIESAREAIACQREAEGQLPGLLTDRPESSRRYRAEPRRRGPRRSSGCE